MINEQQVIKQIGQKKTKAVIYYIIAMLFFPALTTYFVLMPFTSRHPMHFDLTAELITISILVLTTIIVDYVIAKKYLIPAIKERKNPSSDPVFRAFKNTAELTTAVNSVINSAKIYEYKDIKLTNEYIADLKDYRTVIRLADVTSVAVLPALRGNDDVELLVSDKYKRACQYDLDGDKNATIHLAELIGKHCPNVQRKDAD